MKLEAGDLDVLVDRAIDAVCEAGRLVSSARPTEVVHKPGARSLASQVLTDVDRRSQELILRALEPSTRRFELAVLTEEADDDRSRLEHDYFWCIDPIDGTLCFIEDRPGYAVSVALVARDGTPQVGVVYDPVGGTLFHAVRGQGAFRDRRPWAPSPTCGELSLFTDHSFRTSPTYDRLATDLARIGQQLGYGSLRVHTTGGAVMNACRVLMHPPACYFKLPKPSEGGGSLWDFAAPACLFAELGAVATDIHGDSLDLNRPDSTFMNHRGVLFASDAVLAEQIRELARRQPRG